MALIINDNCTACDACKPVCPNEAIAVGDPISRRNIVLKVGDVLRARKAGETVTANWSVIVRSTS